MPNNFLRERRDFLKIACATAVGCFFANRMLSVTRAEETALKEVAWYRRLDDGVIECLTCPKKCRVLPGGRGICGNKQNNDGNYYTLVYSKPCSIHTDPIEKKPFFHFLPGANARSLATAGCNFACKFCQNWQISQAKPESVDNIDLTPPQIVRQAQADKAPVIAFTYTEPTVFYEYMRDIAALAREKDIHSVMVSNGYINEEPMRALCRHLSAVKIDLKSFSDDFYRKYCGGRLQPVLDTLLLLKKLGIWYEIVVLLIPALNDGNKEIKAMCVWIKDNLGDTVPVHFSRFSPMYQLTNLSPTPVQTMENAYQIAVDCGLKFVYLGNITPHQAESTYCPKCRKLVVKRTGYIISEMLIKNNKCPHCSALIPGVWNISGKN